MKIFITKEIPAIGIQMLKEAGHEVTVNPDEDTPIPQHALIENCRQHDALIVSGFAKLDEHFFSQCSHLKVIALFSVGYDSVDMNAATRYNIPVSNTPDVLSKATAEIAFLLMLCVARKAFYQYQKIVNGQWQQFEPVADLGIDLHHKTIGIFGLGNIGFEMARKCRDAYGMQVIYHNRSRNKKAEEMLHAKYVSFDELLQQSDVLSVHANLSKASTGIFNADAFKQMKPNAIFINTARGAMHDESALKNALDNNIIWGAGLDVTNPEPMDKNNPLLFMPNVCVLPHIGSATRETRNEMAELVARNIIAGLKGERLPTIVNSDVYD
ncbi:2-hydroxyacid dehydrogenase [Haoranjiania flava]|uniref:Glyoxylate/hydroxypyruvate reductase B n=1 Tax=Haoranjiania flava TaxID=1856322 RepID=A0AAE3LL06_9BACT|nr:D-glycerate dehydrogenase [Haoranjiania flava]MCU7694859.1 D-glycerate dehydrogenase [Haoranjiania flava]